MGNTDSPKPRKRYAPKSQARRALRNAVSRAAKHDSPEAKAATLSAGISTALAWLDGTHSKLAR